MIYRISEEKVNFDGKEISTYGIAAFDQRGELLDYVRNITPTRQKAEKLLEKCSRLNVSPCHLKDVAEDFIISDEY